MVRASLVACLCAVALGDETQPGALMREQVVRAGMAVVEQMNLAPAPSTQNKTYRVKMSDGAKLHTETKLPYPYDQKRPAVLDRTPYGTLAGTPANMIANMYVATGFAAVSQHQRGTAYSGGRFDLWRTDSTDAQDTVEWIIKQPWSNGEVFTVGFSADGIGEAVMALTTGNSNLKGQWWSWTTGNAHRFIYPEGVYREDTLENYLGTMAPLIHDLFNRVRNEVRAHEEYSNWYDGVTLCRSNDLTSPHCHYSAVTWPTVHTVGWFDMFRQTHLESFLGLRQASDSSVRDEHVLVVGPLGHCSLMTADQGSQSPDILYTEDMNGLQVSFGLTNEMFSGLSHGPIRSRLGRVNLFVMGGFDGPTAGNYWTSLDEFPESKTPVSFFLHDDGSLVDSPQTGTFNPVSYKYDPSLPTPMLGSNNLPVISKNIGCGTYDQKDRESRSDVVIWDTEALTSDMPIVGRVAAKLFVSSDAKDTDFVITISDVSPGGKSMLLTHGAVRMRWRDGDETESAEMVEGTVYPIEVFTDTTAYIFPKGHRVRITVASAAAPYFEPNSNTGKFMDKKHVIASNSVHEQSTVTFPQVDMNDIPENHGFVRSGILV